MPSQSRLSERLEHWKKLRQQGQTVSADELGRDCPELIPELKRQIEAFEELGPFLQIRISKRDEEVTQQDEEIQDLLRRRLIGVSLLFLVPTLATRVLITLDDLFYPNARRFDYLTFYPEVRDIDPLYYVIIVAVLLPLLALASRWRASMHQLRAVEIYLFGFAVAVLAWAQYRWYNSGWLQGVAYPDKESRLLLVTGESVSLPWFLLTVLYGALIPNSGRRCALAVAGMIVSALSVTLLAGGRAALSGPYFDFIVCKMAFWMCVAGFIAVYGSHRLHVLRQQAFEAQKLGQYLIKKRLGAGGMGEVFLAEHQLLRRLCAVKLIRPDRSGDTRSLQRFQREVQLTAALTHSSIVEIYDYGHTEDGLFYYVMEYLPGLSLQELIDRFGPLPPERVVHLLRQICWGLREAHACGLIHRDIKPSNIIICERGRVFDVAKLVDFGLVKGTASSGELSIPDLELPAKAADATATSTAETLTEAGAVVGTPHYMSPEQISGTQVDGRSDVYSLGIVAYYALTKEHPFKGITYRDIAAAHLRGNAPPLIDVCPTVDVDLHGVIMRCLEKDRDARFPDVDSMEKALASCSCAERWTPAQAEAWWRQQLPELVAKMQAPA